LDVATRIKKERKRLGLSQAELSRKIGSDTVTVAKLECGKQAPDIVQLSLIASAGADVQYILTGTRTSPAVFTQAQRMAGGSAEVLSKEEQALLYSYRISPGPCEA
jgi:transcriptional regulator with XRE-family HTH domain